jgi:hypothetical protein
MSSSSRGSLLFPLALFDGHGLVERVSLTLYHGPEGMVYLYRQSFSAEGLSKVRPRRRMHNDHSCEPADLLIIYFGTGGISVGTYGLAKAGLVRLGYEVRVSP